MRHFIIVLLAAISFSAVGQDFSTINFVTNNHHKAYAKIASAYAFNIYLNDQLAGTINNGENLQYKAYSEGRFSLVIIVGTIRMTKTIDVKHGNTYYFEINNWNGRYDTVSEEKGKEYFDANTNTVKAAEDRSHPINPNSVSEDDGPKQGTCFQISKKGYFVTNYHVISGAKTVQVEGIGGDYSTLYGVDVVATDAMNDLALLKIKNQNVVLDEVPYSISKTASEQGTKAFVLGYPMTTSMGNEIKLTDGLISAKSGYKGSISLYQFSAPVQPGNSGSPLFNEDGELIGVINSKLEGAENAGYAIKSQFLLTFLGLIDGLDIPQTTNNLKSLSLADKTALLKKGIFIVKTTSE